MILNHALIEPEPDFYEMREEGFDNLRKSMEHNFFSFVQMTHTAWPFLLNSTTGSIGVVSSILGKFFSDRRSMHCWFNFHPECDFNAEFEVNGILGCETIVQLGLGNGLISILGEVHHMACLFSQCSSAVHR